MLTRRLRFIELRNCAALVVCLSVAFVDVNARSNELSGEIVTLKISSERMNYQLGELITVETKIRNNTSKPIEVGGDAPSGAAIKIAFTEDGEFKFYVPPPEREFTVDGINPGVVIGPHKTFVQLNTILWNYKPEVSHLNVDAARPLVKDRILSGYAMPVAGTYFIKNCFITRSDGSETEIDTKPIRIVVSEPKDDDLSVWKMMKDDERLGYFIQKGDLPMDLRYHNAEHDNLVLKINEILTEYPDSIYSPSLLRARDLFIGFETKRDEFTRTLQKLNRQ